MQEEIMQPNSTSQEEQMVPVQTPVWRKRLFVILAFLIVALLLLVLISLFKSKSLQNISVSQVATPTPIAPPVNGFQNLSIFVSPGEDSNNNSLFATISATFSRPFSLSERAYTTISLSPDTKGAITWSKSSDTIMFTPSGHLDTGTTYVVTLIYGSHKKIWSFSTASNSTVSQQDINNVQVQSDEKFGEWQQQVNSSYPWYNSLPLQTNEYYTYFDLDSKKFISYLYVSPSDKSKVESLKEQITRELQTLGVNTQQYNFLWNIAP